MNAIYLMRFFTINIGHRILGLIYVLDFVIAREITVTRLGTKEGNLDWNVLIFFVISCN